MPEGIMHLRDFAAVDTPERLIVDMMSKQKAFINNVPSRASNKPTSHVTAVTTALPTVDTKIINRGVTPSHGAAKQVEFAMGAYETRTQYDSAIEKFGSTSERVREVKMHNASNAAEAIGQQIETDAIYGNGVIQPGKFTGLAYYYDDKKRETGRNIQAVLKSADAANAAGLTSLYLVGVGGQALHAIHAPTSPAGIFMEELPIQTIADSEGKQIDYRITKWNSTYGVVLHDWRTCGRICNIPTGGDTNDDSWMIPEDADGKLQSVKAVFARAEVLANRLRGIYDRAFWICNPDLLSLLTNQSAGLYNGSIKLNQELNGETVTMLKNIPIYTSDAILKTEGVVPNII